MPEHKHVIGTVVNLPAGMLSIIFETLFIEAMREALDPSKPAMLLAVS